MGRTGPVKEYVGNGLDCPEAGSSSETTFGVNVLRIGLFMVLPSAVLCMDLC